MNGVELPIARHLAFAKLSKAEQSELEELSIAQRKALRSLKPSPGERTLQKAARTDLALFVRGVQTYDPSILTVLRFTEVNDSARVTFRLGSVHAKVEGFDRRGKHKNKTFNPDSAARDIAEALGCQVEDD